MGTFIHAGFIISHNKYQYNAYMTGELREFFYDRLPGARFGAQFSQSLTECSGKDEQSWPEAQEWETENNSHNDIYWCIEPGELYPIYMDHYEKSCNVAHLFKHAQKSISQFVGTVSLLAIAGVLLLCTKCRR